MLKVELQSSISLLELESPDVLRPASAARPLARARVGVVTAHSVLAPIVVEFLFLKTANDE